jgi:lipopolysaccharide biosynthesis glycosyltransferase
MREFKFSFFRAVLLVGMFLFFPLNAGLYAIRVPNQTVTADTGKRSIAVVFSADNNYAKYLYVALYSALKNAAAETHYDFYIQISNDFDQKYRDEIVKLSRKYPCTVCFIEMDGCMPRVLPGHFPPSAYYRLLAAKLLPHLGKCIYVDTDVLILKDLTKLYDTEMEDCYLAGVESGRPTYLNHLSKYLNSGVLVMNLDLIRQANLTDTFARMSEYGVNGKDPYTYPDQDILNIACEGKIKVIDYKYNFGIGVTALVGIWGEVRDKESFITAKARIDEALNAAVIMHFMGPKPWNDSELMFANMWWEYAKDTPFHGEIVQAMAKK